MAMRTSEVFAYLARILFALHQNNKINYNLSSNRESFDHIFGPDGGGLSSGVEETRRLTKSFDDSCPPSPWYFVCPATRQIIADLITLRSLAQ